MGVVWEWGPIIGGPWNFPRNGLLPCRKRLDQDQASQLLAESSGDRSGGHLGEAKKNTTMI